MSYFKCVSHKGPILVCYLSITNGQVNVKWGPGQKKIRCWTRGWPMDYLFVLDKEGPNLFHHSKRRYKKFLSNRNFSPMQRSIIQGEDFPHFIPVMRGEEIGVRGKYYCLRDGHFVR